MNFKDLMKVVNDLSEGVIILDNYLHNLELINDLNGVDKERIEDLKKVSVEYATKAHKARVTVYDYVSKKGYRELNKPLKRGF